MGNELSKVGLVSIPTKSTVPSAEPIHVRMVENVILIWFDSRIDTNMADTSNNINQLRRIVHSTSTFTDTDQCIQFIKSIINERTCLITSGSLGQEIVPHIHNMFQIDSILIFCNNKTYHDQWSKNWPKIKGVFTHITPICEALHGIVQQCEQNIIPISLIDITGNISTKSLDELNPSFMYVQLLKEALLTIKFEQKNFTDFIQFCSQIFADNENELKNVRSFEQKYRDATPIGWYTYKCFLSPMLNRALRLMDADLIIKLGFFITDLHRQIEQLHREQYGGNKSSTPFTVYRGQGMFKINFERMAEMQGGLLSFNNFLFASKNPNLCLEITHQSATNPDMIGVLFVIKIDPAKSTIPFASIDEVSHHENKKDDVLFSIPSIFRIDEIKAIDENQRLFQVSLTLIDENDQHLRLLTNRIREEIKGTTGWDQLGELLYKMNQFEIMQQVYEILLEQTNQDIEKANIYHQLGKIKACQQEYHQAIGLNEKSLELRQSSLPLCHPDLAKSFNNLGLIYCNLGDYSKAFAYFEKTLELDKKTLPTNHPILANSYNNLAGMYENLQNYSQARIFYERALHIGQHLLPSNHPDLLLYRNNLQRMKNK